MCHERPKHVRNSVQTKQRSLLFATLNFECHKMKSNQVVYLYQPDNNALLRIVSKYVAAHLDKYVFLKKAIASGIRTAVV